MDQGLQLRGTGLQPANGRAQGPREQGVLGGVVGDGRDQHGEERGEGLGEGAVLGYGHTDNIC